MHLKSTDELVHCIDATSSDVMFPVPCTDCEEGRTVTFSINFNFDAGESYYILIDGGTLKGSMILKLKEGICYWGNQWRYHLTIVYENLSGS